MLANWPTSGCCSEYCAGCCSGCCPGCSGSCLPLGGVGVLSRVLCRGAVQGAPDHVCLFRVLPIMFLPLGGVRVLQGGQGAPDHGAVQGC